MLTSKSYFSLVLVANILHLSIVGTIIAIFCVCGRLMYWGIRGLPLRLCGVWRLRIGLKALILSMIVLCGSGCQVQETTVDAFASETLVGGCNSRRSRNKRDLANSYGNLRNLL